MKKTYLLVLTCIVLITGCSVKKEKNNITKNESDKNNIMKNESDKNMYVKIENDKILVSSNYNNEIDIILMLSKHGKNSIFNVFNLYKVSDIGELPNDDFSSKKLFLSDISVSDWFGPYIVSAKNNADGDRILGEFTGGNHDYLNGSGGTTTARTNEIVFKVNNKIVNSYDGYVEYLDIYWTNYVQAYNTKKKDGSGREVLKESFHLSYTGNNIWNIEVEIEFLEDVLVNRYYGLQAVNSNWNQSIMFGADDKWQSITKDIKSNRKEEDAIILKRNNDQLKITIDNSYGLGKREYLDNDYGAFINVYPAGSKSYFYLIKDQEFNKGDIVSYRGTYEFSYIK